MKKNYMFTPGPTMVPQEVLLAEAAPMIHHRTAQFSQIMAEVVDALKGLFGTAQDVYLIMGSGTAAMEAALANVCSRGDKAICASGGKFGERWTELAKAYGCGVVEIEVQWGKSLAVEQAEAALDEHPDARALYITQSETSTGALTDVEAIARLTRRRPTLLAVDAITGIGVHPFKMDEWGVDIAVSGSQKGCMTPPGLAFIAVSPRAWPAVEACRSPRYYLDLRAMKKNWEKTTTPFTAAVSLIRGLHKGLEMILAEGLDAVHARHARMANASRSAVAAIGLKLVAEKPANGVTAVWGPEGLDTGELINLMRDKYGVTMAGGQDKLKGRAFRIGHMGYVSEEDILVAIGTLEKALAELGYEFEKGAALRAAQQALG
ncbi:MAG: alanine--glyoxylate aminotransferase family protein [Candidatus Brocadiae bacterium]|nr:alanine--glyoxylate aminotransferase family protein [Candidatus Brocadiia bacterium]